MSMIALIAAGGPIWAEIASQKLGITNESQHKSIDEIEEQMLQFPEVQSPVDHIFTPGLYCRRIEMAKGTFISSKIHKTRHPFFVLSGKVAVWDARNGVQIITAPHMGITEPGTRRLLLIAEDCTWITAHPTPHETVEDVENEIIQPRIKASISNESKLECQDILGLLQNALEENKDATPAIS